MIKKSIPNLNNLRAIFNKFQKITEIDLCFIVGGDLSDELLDYRIKFALTQKQLAEQIGVSRQALSKWELGISLPSHERLKIVSKILCLADCTE